MTENRRFYRLAGEWTVVCHPLDDSGVPGPSIGGRTATSRRATPSWPAGVRRSRHPDDHPARRRRPRLYVGATVVRAGAGNVHGVRFDDLDRTQRADLSRFVFAQARLRQAGADTTDESAA